MSITQSITDLSTPPSRSDPSNFDTRADTFLGELDNLADELNTFAEQANSTATLINSDKDDAEAAKTGAESAQTSAEAARDLASSYKDQAAISANYQGAWSAGTYTLSQSVSHSGSFWICGVTSTTGEPGVSSDWDELPNFEVLNAISETINANTTVAVKTALLSDDHNPNWPCETVNYRDFPRALAIHCEADNYKITDLTDSSLPTYRTRTLTGEVISSVDYLNGVVYIGTANGVFVDDYRNENLDSTSATYDTTTTLALVDNAVNDIAIAQDDSGNNIPIFFTDGGVTQILNDSANDWTDNAGTYINCQHGAVINDYIYWSCGTTSSNKVVLRQPALQALTDTAYTNWDVFSGDSSSVWASDLTPIHHGGQDSVIQGIAKNSIATNRGLIQFIDNISSSGNGIHNLITGDSVAGLGLDICGAWMGSNVAETLSGSELLVDGSSNYTGDFTQSDGALVSPYTAWISSFATLAVVSNELEVTSTATQGHAYDTFNCVAGKTYTVIADCRKGTSNEARLDVWQAVSPPAAVITTSGTNVTLVLTFVATGSTFNVLLRTGNTAGTAYFDNVHAYQADPDLSYNNNALTTVGSITKSAVATGSELMAYSGFSASNYLYQPYNSDLDFGTGDFYVMGWVNYSATGNNTIVSNQTPEIGSATSGFYLDLTGDVIRFYTYEGVNSTSVAGTQTVSKNVWHFITALRVNGDLYVYLDGSFYSSTLSGVLRNVTNTNAKLVLGMRITDNPILDGRKLNGKTSLLRIGAGTPTADQISTIYESEKHLFTEGAQFSTSQLDITAIDYNETTQELIEQSNSGYTKRGNNQLVVHESGSDAGTVVAYEDSYLVRGS